jgi:tRNA (cytidine/uridine-2'-O-)-methyltransferase
VFANSFAELPSTKARAKSVGMIRIALYQPDMPGNVGTIARLAACFGVGLDIVEPCGFPLSDKRLARAAMDYAEAAEIVRHPDWDAFRAARPGRLVLMTTRGGARLPEARFAPGDTLLMGSESGGVPDAVHAAADLAVRIPLAAGARSLNVAVAAGIALAEALRQTEGWPT